jgi:glutathione synthase/RimK-type ligase-like ATP-grasp enzyme
MSALIVVDRPSDWTAAIEGTQVATARDYLTDPAYSGEVDYRVINLCRADRYQGRGYYVSLLADARGHQPLPEVKSVEDLQSPALLRALAREVDELIEDAIGSDDASEIRVDAFFGRDPRSEHPVLAQQLFTLVKVPLLRATFGRQHGRWRLRSLRALSAGAVPPEQRTALDEATRLYLAGGTDRRTAGARERGPRLAILYNPRDVEPSSNADAIERFRAAARTLGMQTDLVDRRSIGRLAEFDGLFIRDTTNVGHYTYEFARRAFTDGLVVIDDPDSILQCTNKVYLHELMTRHRIPVPKTLMVHRDNVGEIVSTLGLPCVLKQPDSGFSLGVDKIEAESEVVPHVRRLLQHSELVIAQEYVPTEFDWRVGILDRRPLYVCRYHMAPGHWQIIKHEAANRIEGQTVTMSVGEAPEVVVRTALRAANLIGDGLYGVDLKQVNGQCLLIEVNDNPTINVGAEDAVLGDALYREIMGVFCRRISERKWKAAA